MQGKIFACPLSGESVVHPCPCGDCPGNLAQYNPQKSCAYNLPDLSYTSLSEATGLDSAQVRQTSQAQATELAHLVRDLQFVTERVPDEACSNCGYVHVCTNSAICAERYEIASEILVNCKHQTPLKLRHLWFAIVSRHASFLPRRHREALRELVNLKDLGEKYE